MQEVRRCEGLRASVSVVSNELAVELAFYLGTVSKSGLAFVSHKLRLKCNRGTSSTPASLEIRATLGYVHVAGMVP